jgi:hypothetical protein
VLVLVPVPASTTFTSHPRQHLSTASQTSLIADHQSFTMAAMNAQSHPTVYPNSHVGFDSITAQIEKKLLKRGFQFNVICVGQYNSCIDV